MSFYRHSKEVNPATGRKLLALVLYLVALATTTPAVAQLSITEFMASNRTSIQDEDGGNSDWIELHNESFVTLNLAGWRLAGSTNLSTAWVFPSTNLGPNRYLIVFASGKDRRSPGAPLHTDFKLSSAGEYLAVVAPDGATITSEFSPGFPPQVTDVSFGLVRHTAAVPLLAPGAVARVLVPADDSLGQTWSEPEFDDRNWTAGTTGIGYDTVQTGVNFLPLIGLNVESMMYGKNATLYARIPFVVSDPANWVGLTLRLRFEDGFVAYLNGQEVARSNAPALTQFNSAALAARGDAVATNRVDFDISDSTGFLLAGTNVLAFQLLNSPVASPDVLLLPELLGITLEGSPETRYFPVPSPGAANRSGVATIGPVITGERHTPTQPKADEGLAVTARIRPAFAPVASAEIHYRIMFGAEQTLPFLDDGAHADGAAGDGIYGATIPPGAAKPGDMIRWYMTASDQTGTNSSRWPTFTSTNESPAYFGTVASNPALTNPLPVFQWFIQTPAAADTALGTRCSVYWNGEFYDNVHCRVRGATAPYFRKKPYKFDFNPGAHLRLRSDQPRVSELNLNSTYQDKAYLRAPLTWEAYHQAGVPACDAFNVRVEQNNAFYSVAVCVEQVDETFLERRGLDSNGALYKMYNGLTSSTAGVEKRTRRSENNADLQVLVDGLRLNNPSRATVLFDQFDIPEIINYLAAGIISQDFDRMIKNFFLHRDTEGTGLWRMLPWDKDLTFGVCALECDVINGNTDLNAGAPCNDGAKGHPLVGTQSRNFVGHVNNLFDAVYSTPVTRQMFLRRLRTLMDQQLQPPGTPREGLYFENRIDALLQDLAPDAALDLVKWRSGFGQLQALPAAVQLLEGNYFSQRRVHLYTTHGIDNLPAYPAAAGIPHAQSPDVVLHFGAIEFNPASQNQAEEYVELLNPGDEAVDVSGWSVAGAIRFVFAPGTVIPAKGHAFLSPDVAAFRGRSSPPRRGQDLLVLGNYDGELSARGESLQLSSAAGRLIDTTSYPGSPSHAQRFLRVTELMYHPPGGGGTADQEAFEYIELKNLSTRIPIDLRGVRFTSGILFDFTSGRIRELPPGGSLIIADNVTAFRTRYGFTAAVAGEYSGNLGNGGERIRWVDSAGEEVLDFAYNDRWVPETDGLGRSLVVVDEFAEPDSWSSADQWEASPQAGGSPGSDNGARVFLRITPVGELVWPLAATGFVLQVADSLQATGPPPPDWREVTAIPIETADELLMLPLSAAEGARFYRLFHP